MEMPPQSSRNGNQGHPPAPAPDQRPAPSDTPRDPSIPAPDAAGRMDVSLIGALPCIVCGYELQGLSIRGACPECGTLVRATILHRVDPKAEEFVPLYAPRLVGAGLVAWIGGALVVVAAFWARRATELYDAWAISRDPREWLGLIAIAGCVVSFLGAISIVRPSRETRRWKSLAAVIGTAAYVPSLWAIARIAYIDSAGPPAMFGPSLSPERDIARLLLGVSLMVACLGLRFVARDMAKRSLALRTGRVDRQTLLAIALAAAIATVGSAMRLWATASGGAAGSSAVLTLNAIGGALVFVASVFITIGLAGALIDSLRIARTLWRPGPTMRQLIGEY
ncbi:MAG: hypothetical protein ACTS3F_14825 [Phycisphaerales bacterium]